MGGTPGAPALNDVGFRGAWSGRTLRSAVLVARGAPCRPDVPARLTDAQYIELIAAILEANGNKPGAAPLPARNRRCSGAS